MLESLAGLLSVVRQTSPAILLGVAIATGTILFASESVLQSLGLVQFHRDYQPFLGAAFVAAVSVLAAQGIAALWRVGQEAVRDRRKTRLAEEWNRRRRETLHSLTPDEKAYLVPFVLGGQNTMYFRIEDGVAGGLVAKDIIYRASSVGRALSGFAHNIQPWAREYLEENPELLEGANPEPSGPPS